MPLDEAYLRGLRAISGLSGFVRRILLYGGDRRKRTPDGIDVLGWDDFTGELSSGVLWPAE